MTNEEKAQEIIGGGCNKQGCRECGGSLSVAEGCVEFRHLKEMAEWKEEQIIARACLWLSLNADVFGFFKKTKLKEMVNEFAKAMKGGEE